MPLAKRRNYQPMIDKAVPLVYDYSGYLSTAGVTQRNQAQAAFNGERRAFVYDLFREKTPQSLLAMSVMADLDRIEAEAPEGNEVFDYLRAELGTHIGKAVRHNGLQRFAIRWGPPALGVAAALIYFYVKFRQIEG